MNLRLLLVFGLASVAMGQVAPGGHPVRERAGIACVTNGGGEVDDSV